MNSIKFLKVVFALFMSLAIVGCGKSSEKKTPITQQISDSEIAERKRIFEERAERLDAELNAASPQVLASLFESCKSIVLNYARSTTNYGVFMVDQYSADIYQAEAHFNGGRYVSTQERVKIFLDARKGGGKNLEYMLPLSYTVTISSPTKVWEKLKCKIEPGLALEIDR
ncbi:hypothetical protein ICN11_07510 [Polynucleobacter sp. 78F-HAINBA]|jgi:hypothetical protein|uniref:hypothetical protein n=1 Tax=Polynucleobacter sp. 78F-HAINBA TaxID=2689099 RepID=UPI001C0B1112|nr:hypothetical protein [Polynucleobacter sp. 78F-HAINBA]MBU3591859.1 hypothetical protein [Polynucleobacter sp. 78F-HAINBA]